MTHRITSKPITQYGAFVRYSIEKHRALLDEWPEIQPILYAPTYAEAEKLAKAETLKHLGESILAGLVSGDVQWINRPHSETDDNGKNDPLNLVGSWGWKTK